MAVLRNGAVVVQASCQAAGQALVGQAPGVDRVDDRRMNDELLRRVAVVVGGLVAVHLADGQEGDELMEEIGH